MRKEELRKHINQRRWGTLGVIPIASTLGLGVGALTYTLANRDPSDDVTGILRGLTILGYSVFFAGLGWIRELPQAYSSLGTKAQRADEFIEQYRDRI